MKVVDLEDPVRADWFLSQGLRLDAATYLSGSLQTRRRLEALPNTVPLESLTSGHNGGLFNGPRFRRIYLTDPAHSVPFLGSKDMMTADLSRLPRLRKSDADSRGLSYLRLKPGMTLISCSGFYAGRRSYVRPDMDKIWSSEDVLKVEPDPDKIRAGYLYAYLASRFGEAFIRSSVYGSAVKHIEPSHLIGLPVPRFGDALEQKVHDLIQESARLRAEFQAGLVSATEDVFKSVGLCDLLDYRWHGEGRDLGFGTTDFGAQSIRALNFVPRSKQILEKLSSVDHRTLGDICAGGLLSSGVRFKRIDADSKHGVQLIGQRQGFWMRPEGRWISAEAAPKDIFADEETILIASQGTLGENEVFCRPIMVYGAWTSHAYTQHFLRVVSGDALVSGAYLFAFLRSEVAFRVLRSMGSGGKQQDIHAGLRSEIPIPLAPRGDRERIEATVRQAHRARDQADIAEEKALAVLTAAIEGADV